MEPEVVAVAKRYARRSVGDLYSMLRPEVWLSLQERERAILGLLSRYARRPLAEQRLVEVGCGYGGNLLEMLRIGFEPGNLVGSELLPDRAVRARSVLPAAIELYEGDASELALSAETFDIVYVSLVFSSLLDAQFRAKLASRMWQWVRPGGAVLWYDFTVDNPSNPNVQGVGRQEIQRLFPGARTIARRVTLAPPIARRVAPLHPALYTTLNLVPWLRTHLLCWIEKQ